MVSGAVPGYQAPGRWGKDRMRYTLPILLAAACLAPGCVQLKAPDKPIEINLNVNIKQEVVVRLEKDVQDLIRKNPGVF